MADSVPTFFAEARRSFHKSLLNSVLKTHNGVASNADKDSKLSIALARGIREQLGEEAQGARLAGQTSGSQFEIICRNFIELTFKQLTHIRPGAWEVRCIGGRNRMEIASYEQYAHLRDLQVLAMQNVELAAALGNDYTITPDIVLFQTPMKDEQINGPQLLVDDTVAVRASLRARSGSRALLHASISCKWTLRSDRAQNARAEALNLMRNRKGHLPHIAVVTGEPLPSRIASIALGTGDIDCTYHFALPELMEAALPYEDASELLRVMVEGKRLKDIADLPLDLAI